MHQGPVFLSFHGLNRSSVGDAGLLEEVAIPEMVRHRAYHPGNQQKYRSYTCLLW